MVASRGIASSPWSPWSRGEDEVKDVSEGAGLGGWPFSTAGGSVSDEGSDSELTVPSGGDDGSGGGDDGSDCMRCCVLVGVFLDFLFLLPMSATFRNRVRL